MMKVTLCLVTLSGLAASSLAQLAIPTPTIPGGNDPRTNAPWQGPGAYPRTVTAANFDVSIRPGTTLNGNSDTGDQALKVFPIRSGPRPYTWTSGWTNEGDIDANISPVEIDNPLSYPPDAFIRLRDGRDPVSGANDGGGLRTYAWSINQYHGSVMMSVRHNGRDNADVVFGIPVGTLYGVANVSADTFRSGRAYNMINGQHTNGGGSLYLSMHYAGTPGNQELNADLGAAWFPFAQGWIGGYVNQVPGDLGAGLFVQGDGQTAATPALPGNVVTWNTSTAAPQATVVLPGVDSARDGILLAQPYQDNNSPDYVVATPANGGWDLTYRRTDLSSEAELVGVGSCKIHFVYIPYSATNAIAGRVTSGGSIENGTGGFTVTRLGVGRYQVTIPGKSDLTGTLLLQTQGFEADSGTGTRAFMSYVGNATGFEVQARRLVVGNPGNAFGEDTETVDADFALVYVDHTTPLSVCAVDFNRDGFVDFFDFDDFISCFEGTGCPFARTADFNVDGFVDFFDFDDFVAGFEAGC
jgi:hypothetical protein